MIETFKRYPFIITIGLFIAIICIVAPSVYGTDTKGWIVCISIASLSLIIVSILIIKNKTSTPNFITNHNVSVWFDKSLGYVITQKSIEDLYGIMWPFLTELAKKHRKIPTDKFMKQVIGSTHLHIKNKPISSYGLGWDLRNKAGLQKGNLLYVQWRGSFHQSAFAHEVLHQFREAIIKNPDSKHEDKAFWDLENRMNRAIKAELDNKQ